MAVQIKDFSVAVTYDDQGEARCMVSLTIQYGALQGHLLQQYDDVMTDEQRKALETVLDAIRATAVQRALDDAKAEPVVDPKVTDPRALKTVREAEAATFKANEDAARAGGASDAEAFETAMTAQEMARK